MKIFNSKLHIQPNIISNKYIFSFACGFTHDETNAKKIILFYFNLKNENDFLKKMVYYCTLFFCWYCVLIAMFAWKWRKWYVLSTELTSLVRLKNWSVETKCVHENRVYSNLRHSTDNHLKSPWNDIKLYEHSKDNFKRNKEQQETENRICWKAEINSVVAMLCKSAYCKTRTPYMTTTTREVLCHRYIYTRHSNNVAFYQFIAAFDIYIHVSLGSEPLPR